MKFATQMQTKQNIKHFKTHNNSSAKLIVSNEEQNLPWLGSLPKLHFVFPGGLTRPWVCFPPSQSERGGLAFAGWGSHLRGFLTAQAASWTHPAHLEHQTPEGSLGGGLRAKFSISLTLFSPRLLALFPWHSLPEVSHDFTSTEIHYSGRSYLLVLSKTPILAWMIFT